MSKKDLLIKIHGYIASDGRVDTYKLKEKRGNNVRIRQRLRTRFFNKEKTLIFDFIKAIKKLYPDIKNIRYTEKRIEVEIRSQIITKDILKLGKVGTFDWEIPKKISDKQQRIWIRAFADGEGTVYYNKNYNRYIAIDSTNLKGLKSVSNLLQKCKIVNSIYKVKYKSYVSYRLRIYRKENLINYNKFIGFTHPLKKIKLRGAIKSYKN